MQSVTFWIMVNLMAHQPMPAQAPYAFASLQDCQHAIHVMDYSPREITCRQLTYIAYGDYGAKELIAATNAQGKKNAAYDLHKLDTIIHSVPPKSPR